MKKIMLSFTFLMAVIGAFAFNAQAATIYGYTSFSGTFQSDAAALNDATYFSSFTDVVVSTGGGTYDYAAIPGNELVDIETFIFDPDFNGNMDFWTINYGGMEYSYNLLTSEIEYSAVNSIVIQGTGIASITGFENTESIWFLSATSSGDRSTFTLSTLVPPDYQAPGPGPVPEPTTMILFGMGILGFAGVIRKKIIK